MLSVVAQFLSSMLILTCGESFLYLPHRLRLLVIYYNQHAIFYEFGRMVQMKTFLRFPALLWAALAALSNMTFADSDTFVPNDPPRREASTLVYETIPLTDMRLREALTDETESTTTMSSLLVVSSEFLNGRQLVGRLSLQVSPDLLSQTQDLRLSITLHDAQSGESRTVAEDYLPESAAVQLDVPGIYATELRVAVEGSNLTVNPLKSMNAQAIVIGSETRLMLLGDSITEGKFADDMMGYRKVLYDQLHMSGYDVDFVGEFGEPPYEGQFQGGMKINDFYPSNMTTNARGRMDVTYAMDTYRPNVVAIHLGTNDLNSETGSPISPYGNGSEFYDTQAGEMATLIDYLLQWHNGTRDTELQHIVVSLIIPIKYQDSVNVEFNAEVARLVNDFRSGLITGQEEPVHLTDHFSRFREWPGLVANGYNALMEDTLHPNTAGHNLMGDTYFKSISQIVFGRESWFRDITWYVGVAGYDHYFENQGIAVADVNADGRDDIYMSRTNSTVPDAHESLYIAGDLPFRDETEGYNLRDDGGSRGVVFVDIDSDGDLDVFNGNSGSRNRLYENLNGIEFRDITSSSGLASVSRVTTGVLAVDVDNDGDMDLYAVNSREPNELYINDGSGHFSLQDRGANDANEPSIPSLSGSAADMDLDGDIDIYITKRDAPNVLFRNDGNGYFTQAAAAAGIDLMVHSNGAVWSDVDVDGDPDLIIAVTRRTDGVSENIVLYENRGDGTFVQKTSATIHVDGYSPIVADFDNDGDDDLVTTFEGDYARFYRNDGGWSFTELAETGAEIHGGDVRGAAMIDLENDGDLDILAARADMLNVVLENQLDNGNNYLKINVEGPNGNAVGYGSKIWVFEAGHLNDMRALIAYKDVVSTTGHISQNSPTQHIGLADETACDLLVEFSDGTLVAQRNVGANQTIRIAPQLSETGAVPAQLSYYSGDDQQGTVGETLSEPLQVQVTDDQGLAVAGASVMFEVTQGDARLFLLNYASDHLSMECETGQLNGAARWVYDETASNQGAVLLSPRLVGNGSVSMQKEISTFGDYYVWLRVENMGTSQTLPFTVDGQTLSLPVSATPEWHWILAQPEPFVLSSGVHSFTIDLTTPDVHVDKLLLTTDANFTPSGMEETNSEPELTDSQGIARRYVQLNQTAGTILVEANLWQDGALLPDSPVVFSVTAKAGPAVSMKETSGNFQQGEPGVALEPFVVTLYDAFDNPVPNHAVTFSVVSGGGTLTTDAIVLTDASGRAQTTLIPGESSSQQQVRAEAENLSGSPVTFTAYISGTAQEMQLISGSGQRDTVMTPLSDPIQVRVLQENDEPAVGYSVQFYTTNAQGLVSSSTSDRKSVV